MFNLTWTQFKVQIVTGVLCYIWNVTLSLDIYCPATRESCYMITTPKLLSEAKSECQSYGSYLVEFETEEEFFEVMKWAYDVKLSANKWFWTGLRHGATYSDWIWEKTGKPFTLTHLWKYGEPDASSSQPVAVVSNNPLYRFGDVKLTTPYLPLCEISSPKAFSAMVPTNSQQHVNAVTDGDETTCTTLKEFGFIEFTAPKWASLTKTFDVWVNGTDLRCSGANTNINVLMPESEPEIDARSHFGHYKQCENEYDMLTSCKFVCYYGVFENGFGYLLPNSGSISICEVATEVIYSV